ncbi:uncharacterized protein EV420DRAFT_1638760 [Desarmillaria tabescens]|uniref:Uncharacterized protein n=1 Tax=Armillaria tabescens TaxID=1929756 RepID=A0AA39TZH1_ARMTA|nr:uncharacterized protein EV420DRAFT_1638760 [Desarmillaria tabescens]KAK0463845.1 hypothetical protein EV420DRAFT_1638760 [Desarmillaria tabescens]
MTHAAGLNRISLVAPTSPVFEKLWQTPTMQSQQPLYSLPHRGDFEECDVLCMIQGPGLWCRTQYQAFQQAYEDVKHLRSLLQMFLQHLQSLPLTFERLHLCVAETQWVALKLQAYMDYYMIFMLRISSPTLTIWKVHSDLVGAFTTSTLTAQEFHKAGIPVWLLRSVLVIPFTRIDQVVDVFLREEHVNLHPCPLHLRKVYVGAASNELKYQAIDTFTQSHFSSPNPFFWTPGVHTSVPAVPNASRTSSERYKPYEHQRGHRRKKDRPANCSPCEGAAILEHRLLLPLHVAWCQGLMAANTAPERSQVPAAGYAFPRLELFVTVQSVEKLQTLLSGWLRLQSGVFALLTPPFNPPLLPHQTWCTVLQFDWLLESSNIPADSAAVVRRRLVLLPRAVRTLLGQANAVRDLDDNDIQAILWELSEVGFRIEMMSLDARLHAGSITISRSILSYWLPHNLTMLILRT